MGARRKAGAGVGIRDIAGMSEEVPLSLVGVSEAAPVSSSLLAGGKLQQGLRQAQVLAIAIAE